MAYDYGSIDLGIKNPFRIQGGIVALRGAATILMAIVCLAAVSNGVESSALYGWSLAGFGFALLAMGIKTTWSGAYQMLRFFVGRSVPASLAPNLADTETYTDENDEVHSRGERYAYNKDDLEKMLVARKNPTYQEPQGAVSRLFHSLFHKLTFLPMPYRNLFQRLAAISLACALGLTSLVFVSFFTATGLLPSTPVTFKLLAAVLCGTLVWVWYSQVRLLGHQGEALEIDVFGTDFLVKLTLLTGCTASGYRDPHGSQDHH